MDQKIIFDLDGTLITCENKQKFVLLTILNSIFQNNDNSVREKLDCWWELKRNGLSTEQALLRMNHTDAGLIAAEWGRVIENFTYCSLDQPFKDSLPCLRFIKKSTNPYIIILTSRNCRFQVYQAVCSYGFDQYIDDLIVVKPEAGSEGKKDWLKRIRPSLFIGDSELDYHAAVSAGINFIALTRGQRSREYLQKSGVAGIEDNLDFINESFICDLKNQL